MSFSDGFFETLRRNKGVWVALDHHYNRAQRSAKVLSMHWPESLDQGEFERRLNLVVPDQQSDVIVRATFNRKTGGGYFPESNEPEVEFFLRNNAVHYPNALLNWENTDEIRQLEPIYVGIYNQSFKMRSPWSFVKSTSAQLFTMAAIDCKNRNLDDLILLNDNGSLCELIYSNLLLEINGVFYSPGVENGAVDGTFLRSISEKLLIQYRSLQPQHLHDADNLYRCNSVRGIQRIQMV